MTPLVSIGLPVFNGGRYLEAALASLLTQSFADFELLISDNASTDCTENICRRHAARDRRIRYFRHATNRGAYWNFDFVLNTAAGQYFMWAASDDVWESTFLQRMVSLHREKPGTAVAFCEVGHIDECGNVAPFSSHLQYLEPRRPAAPADSLVQFIRIGSLGEPENLIYGLMPLKIAHSADLIRRWQSFGPTSDYFMVAQLLRFGSAAICREILWNKRVHAGSETSKLSIHGLRNDFPSLAGVASTFTYGIRFTHAVWRVLGPAEGAHPFPFRQRVVLSTIVGYRRVGHFLRSCLSGLRKRVGSLLRNVPT